MKYNSYSESLLLTAMENEDSRTENNALTHSTSDNHCLDLFFSLATYRTAEESTIKSAFYRAYNENPLIALRIMFWVRDIRGGSGERRIFRILLKEIANTNPLVFSMNPHLVHLIPTYGRWDDLFSFFDTSLENTALSFIKTTLLSETNEAALCAKWMPREKSSHKKIAFKIRSYLKLTPKAYRKLLSKLSSNIVEAKMCEDRWSEINFSHVPSRAMLIYRNAFNKHQPSRFANFLEAVKSKETTIKAGALYPYDILRTMFKGGPRIATTCSSTEIASLDAQWQALPNYMENCTERILPLIDTSGSMYTHDSPNPLQVAVSLGMYIAERNEGLFKNFFMTFSEKPEIVKVLGDNIYNKLVSIAQSNWGYNTNLEIVFTKILDAAVANNMPQDQMPTMILILSDMHFDQACSGSIRSGFAHSRYENKPDITLFNKIRETYSAAGYVMPSIIFWNLAARGKNVPVKAHDTGTALISGFSPSILKQLLNNPRDLTPLGVMTNVIDSPRYQPVTLATC